MTLLHSHSCQTVVIMFSITRITTLLFLLPTLIALKTSTNSILDMYTKINTYGSLSKATAFYSPIQIKLKDINTVRVASYQVPHHQSSSIIRLKRNANEFVPLIELRCNLSNVRIRLIKSGQQRVYIPRRISTAMTSMISYDLTPLLKNNHQRIIELLFDFSVTNQNISIYYYSKSNRNLFSLSSIKHAQRRYRRTILPTDPSSTCAKHEYEIDFNQFSFGQWIIEPKRFNAYICSGSCPNPLSAQYFPSNHAILLSLLRSQRDQGREPLCVPVRLKPLCLLYYDRDELVIKYHRDMVVEECGCR